MVSPEVTIIIPVYNQENFIQDALNSVFYQNFSDWECIIVNDGSTDKSELIIQNFLQKDDRFKYIYQNNSGLSQARNTGISYSRGNFFVFLDSDDLLERQMVEKTVSFLIKNPEYSVVSGAWDHIDEKGQTITSKLGPSVSDNYFQDLLLWNLFPIHATLSRKEIFEKCGCFDTNLTACEDWDFWIRAASAGYKFGYIHDLIAHYRRHMNCMSLDIERMEKNYFHVINKFYSKNRDQEISKLKPFSSIFSFFRLIRYCNELNINTKRIEYQNRINTLLEGVEFNKKFFDKIEIQLVRIVDYEKTAKILIRKTPYPWKLKRYSNFFFNRFLEERQSDSPIKTISYLLLSFVYWPPQLIKQFKGNYDKLLANLKTNL